MTWNPDADASSQRLQVNWASLKDAAVDPYLIWADATGFHGLADDEKPVVRVATWDPQNKVVQAFTGLRTELAGQLAQLPQLWGLPLRTDAQLEEFLERSRPDRIGKPVMAIIDEGIAFAHGHFRVREGGSGRWRSRIRYFWDQSGAPDAGSQAVWRRVWDEVRSTPDESVPLYGRELRNLDALLNQHLDPNGRVDEDACYRRAGMAARVARRLTHGTHVLGLLAGAGPGQLADAASHADLIAVQLPRATFEDTSGVSMAVHVVDALNYIFARVDPGQPLVLNLSYGAMAGPHDGSSLLERAMDQLIMARRAAGGLTELVLPAGNGRQAHCHAELPATLLDTAMSLGWRIQPDDVTDSFLELWYPVTHDGRSVDDLRVSLIAPNGTLVLTEVAVNQSRVASRQGAVRVGIVHRAVGLTTPDRRQVLVALTPSAGPRGQAFMAGEWRVVVHRGEVARQVPVQAWVERDDAPLGSRRHTRQSGLCNPEPPGLVTDLHTGNSLANGEQPRVAGALRSGPRANGPGRAARYSGRWPVPARGQRQRPDASFVVDTSAYAPGLLSCGTRTGQYGRLSGTSMAAPLLARALFNACAAPAATNVQAGGATIEDRVLAVLAQHSPPAPDP